MSERFRITTVEQAQNLIGKRLSVFSEDKKSFEGVIISVGEEDSSFKVKNETDQSRHYLVDDFYEFLLVEEEETSTESDKKRILRLREELKRAEYQFSTLAPNASKFFIDPYGQMGISKGKTTMTITGKSSLLLTREESPTVTIDLEMLMALIDEHRKNL